VGVRRIKVLFVPGGRGAVKQVTIPAPVLALGLMVLCCIAVCACWLIRDYVLNSAQMPRLAQIEKERAQKQREFVLLSQRVDDLRGKFQGLLALDRKLRSVADLGAGQHEIGVLAMGGSGPAQSGLTKAKAGIERHPSFHHVDSDPKGGTEAGTRESHESPGYAKPHHVSFASRTPLQPANGFIICGFGTGVSPGSGKSEFHKGIEISTRLEGSVLAASDGVVTSVGWERGYGRTLLITHAYGLTTFYGNLDRIFVSEGQYVEMGERIAAVGDGELYGPHLHYEVRLNGIPVNPLQFISKNPPLS
jgi:murein DD-endopeptidase MepM/ murein hydrolase activator NlpD